MCVRAQLSWATTDLFCNDWKSLSPVERSWNAPFLVCSFDIETNSSTGKFPDANVEGDAVFQIGMTLRWLGDKDVHRRVCLCYKNTGEVHDSEIICYPSERESFSWDSKSLFTTLTLI